MAEKIVILQSDRISTASSHVVDVNWLNGLRLSPDDVRLVSSTLTATPLQHQGLIQYIYLAWATETGITLRPDMFWCTYLGEIARLRAAHPSLWLRHSKTFTSLVAATEDLSPTEIEDEARRLHPDYIVPAHLTPAAITAGASLLASTTCAAWDVIPPYCGIPAVLIKGGMDEWASVISSIEHLPLPTLGDAVDQPAQQAVELLMAYQHRMIDVLAAIIYFTFDTQYANRQPPPATTTAVDFFNNIFLHGQDGKSCQSHRAIDVVSGWSSYLYCFDHPLALNEYPTHTSIIPYTYQGNDYLRLSSLAYSKVIERFGVVLLDPRYGLATYEILNADKAAELTVAPLIDEKEVEYRPLTKRQLTILLREARWYEPSGLALGRLDCSITICSQCRARQVPVVVGKGNKLLCEACLAAARELTGVVVEYSRDVSDLMKTDSEGRQRLVATPNKIRDITIYGKRIKPSCVKCFSYTMSEFYYHNGKAVCIPCSTDI